MTHHGPIEVSAHIGNCRTTSQIDLPLDLESLIWVFPKGCINTCFRQYPGYMIGPFGEYEQWAWIRNGQVPQYQTGEVENYAPSPQSTHSLYLATEDCKIEVGALSNTSYLCEGCKLRIKVKKVYCNTAFDGYVLEVVLENLYPYPMGVNISLPDGEGFFTNSTHTLNPGFNDINLYFIPSDSFVAGQNLTIALEGSVDGQNCINIYQKSFPSCQTGAGNMIHNDLSLTIHPNPTYNQQTVVSYQTGTKEGTHWLVIRDLYGRSLIQQKLSSKEGEAAIDCSGLAQGTYMVSLQNGDHILKTVKLIVK